MRDEYGFNNAQPNRHAAHNAAGQCPLSTPTTRGEIPPTGIVLIVQVDADHYRWQLKTMNSELLATSAQTYPSLDACREAVEVLVQSMSHPDTIITDAA